MSFVKIITAGHTRTLERLLNELVASDPAWELQGGISVAVFDGGYKEYMQCCVKRRTATKLHTPNAIEQLDAKRPSHLLDITSTNNNSGSAGADL